MEFKDRVVLITGSARGIGYAAAKAFAGKGARVVLNDINQEGLSAAVETLKADGADVVGLAASTSVQADVEVMFKQIEETYGRLDVLINNAGITRDGFLHKITDQQWREVIDVNLTGVFYCLQAAAKIMRKSGYGRIVNLSSCARYGNIGQANYAASKAGLIGLTRTAARELARKNITVNAIAPGAIDTDMLRAVPEKVLNKLVDMIPMARLGTVEELAHLILFLSSEKCSYITGQCVNIDGGWFSAT